MDKTWGGLTLTAFGTTNTTVTERLRNVPLLLFHTCLSAARASFTITLRTSVF